MKTEPNVAMSRHVPAQVAIGVIVFGIGVIALLTNMNVIDFPRISHYWPVLIILIGLAKLLDSNCTQERIAYGGMVLVGVALQLNRLGYDAFNFRTLWPMVLVAVGGAVVYQAVTGRRNIAVAVKTEHTSSDAVLDITVLIAGLERTVTAQDFRGGEVTAIMGGCELDLRNASMESEAVINVFAVMGGITLRIPPDWTVVMNGTPIMGGFEEKTIAPKDSAKRLIIQGYAVMGAVEVGN